MITNTHLQQKVTGNVRFDTMAINCQIVTLQNIQKVDNLTSERNVTMGCSLTHALSWNTWVDNYSHVVEVPLSWVGYVFE